MLEIIPGRPPDLVNPPRGCSFAPRCKYAQDKCIEEEPPLAQAETPGHFYRCWFPVDTPEGQDALARNEAAATAVGPPPPATSSTTTAPLTGTAPTKEI